MPKYRKPDKESRAPRPPRRKERNREDTGVDSAGTTRGAVAVGAPHRKRPVWLIPLLVLLALLIAVAIILALVLSGGDSKNQRSGANTAATTTAAPSRSSTTFGSVTPNPTSPGAGSASAPSTAPGTAPGVGGSAAVNLVGGGGVTPAPATGPLATPGALGVVLFAEAGVDLDSSANAVITSAAQQIRQQNASSVTVVGYTDTIGNAPANQQLSLQRAQAVVSALQQRLGGLNVQFHPQAQGQSQPVASNDTAQGRQLNRRVIIVAP